MTDAARPVPPRAGRDSRRFVATAAVVEASRGAPRVDATALRRDLDAGADPMVTPVEMFGGPAAGARRASVVAQLADHLVAARPEGRPLRVGVDGITAAGKTTLTGELAGALEARGVMALHLTLDGFHHPRARRHRQGRESAAGYYADAYDTGTLLAHVLDPLGPGGDRRVRTRVHDLTTDAVVDEPPVEVPAEAVVLVDGTFLQRPELAGGWDLMVYVDTAEVVARARAMVRDVELFGGPDAVARAYETRYHPACRIYAAAVNPVERADVVIGNDDIDQPVLRRLGRPPD